MQVVLISRGSMSSGQALANSLAERLSFRCVCREDLVKSVDSGHAEINRLQLGKVIFSMAVRASMPRRFSKPYTLRPERTNNSASRAALI